MAEEHPEHVGPQFHGVYVSESTKGPYEGTEKHPQGRLFAPAGSTRVTRKLAPENWLKQSDTPAHDDIISWHGSEESSLPRSDEYEHRQLEPDDSSAYRHVDEPRVTTTSAKSTKTSDGRYQGAPDEPSTARLSACTSAHSTAALIARLDRSSTRRGSRRRRLPIRLEVASPRRRPVAAIVSGKYKSDQTILNNETGHEQTPRTHVGVMQLRTTPPRPPIS